MPVIELGIVTWPRIGQEDLEKILERRVENFEEVLCYLIKVQVMWRKVKSLKKKKKRMTSHEIEAITCSTNIYGVHTMH